MVGRLIANDIKRNLLSARSLLAFIVLILYQWSPVYLEMRLSPEISRDTLYYLALFAGGNSAVFYTIVSIPCSLSWPDDYHYGLATYVATRCSPKIYTRAKAVSAWVSYVLFCFTAVTLFMASVYLVTSLFGVTPERSYFQSGIDLTVTYYYIASKSPFLYYLTRAISISLIAGLFSMISFLFSVYFSNVFLTIAVPPIILYFVTHLIGSLSAPRFLSPLALGSNVFHLHSVAVTLIYTIVYTLLIAGILGWFAYRKMRREVVHA